jgi:type VII secretion-associated serine protease mycosin
MVRRGPLIAVTTLLCAGAIGGTPLPGYAVRAAPAICSSPPASGQVHAGDPWPQQRYAVERVGVLADGLGVLVAVVDSGVDPAHPQLAAAVTEGMDFLDSGDGRIDCHGHGTAVASLIAARATADTPFRGLAPAATILPVRISEQQIIDGRNTGRAVPPEGFAAAIRWAADAGADVMNLSVVLYRDEPAVRAAIAHAVESDVVVVAAAGNLHSSGDPVPYPAAYPGVLGVGAIGPDGLRVPDSQTGAYVDLTAPGSQVIAAAPRFGHAANQGTSFAAAFVAATAALVRQYYPHLDAGQVARRIVATADPAPGGPRSAGYGAGVVNPYRALAGTLAGYPARSGRPLPLAAPDPAAVAAARRTAEARSHGLRLAGAGAAVTGVVVVAALALPRAARRRWRPAG